MIVTQQWIRALDGLLSENAHGLLVLLLAIGVLLLRVCLLLVDQGVREPAIVIQFEDEVFVGLIRGV